jgi:FtsP/CotA-like multicopper oxidase with cupredoxin domain
MSRRRFIGLAAAATGGTALVTVGGLALTGALGPGQPGVLLRSGRPLPTPFQMPLPVPAVLAPTRTDGTADYYDITQKVAQLRIFDDVMTPAWTYNGSFPGPTLVSRTGRRTVVTHRNELPHPVVVHLHGGHTPHDSDGYPTDLILPVGSPPPGSAMPAMAGMPGMPAMPAMPGNPVVGTRTYTYPLNQPAATLWYHDHRMGFTGPAVWYGLAGFHLLTDDDEAALGLPSGDRDVPLMIVDRAFDELGRLTYPSVDPALVIPGVKTPWSSGVLGDVILVNGAPWPVMDVERTAYRFRVLNASNARRYRLTLDPPGALVQIGSDGGLLAAPATHDAIEMAPAERFDVIIDFSRYQPGTQITMRNTLGSGSTRQVMRFVVGSGPATSVSIPPVLADFPAAMPARAQVTRDFLFQNAPGTDGWRINGNTYDPGHPLATPVLGQTELWRFTSDIHHPVHLHLDHFQIVERNNAAPGEYDLGRKDTLDLYPAQSASILVTFTDYAGRFVIHCHNLEHEDMSMMADFITS